jgi:hypothetical protein
MRKGLVLGACVGGLISAAFCQPAGAQFASDRNTPPPAFGGAAPPATTPPKSPANVPQLPGGLQPASYSAPAASGPAGKMLPNGFTLPDPTRREPLAPVPTTIDETAGPHAWAVKTAHGPWMIAVKSYAGPGSRQLAEKLADDIRKTHRTAAYLYERNGEERRAELAKIEAIRKAENDKAQVQFRVMEQAKRDAAASGSVFVGDAVKIKVPKPYHETPEQWAVLIGGFPDMDTARKALDVVKKLPAPKDQSLMDTELIGGEVKDPKSGKTEWKSAVNHVNPYPLAMVVPNPTDAKGRLDDKGKLEPFVVKLNEGVEHGLLTVKKPWTLLVKSYSGLSRTTGQGGGGSVFGKGGPDKNAADALRATAAEAELLVKALRHPEFKPRSYEAFVLHHRTGSLVTVGQFDAPDDPVMLQMAEELKGLTFTPMDKDQKPLTGPDGRPQVLRLLDGAGAFPVPKY